LSWISHYIGPIGSAALFAAIVTVSAPAQAAPGATYIFESRTYAFTHVESRDGRIAVAVDDPQFQALLDRLGVSLTWQPSDSYVVFTTPQRQTISFIIGQNNYDAGGVTQTAAFTPYAESGIPYLPFADVTRALGLSAVPQGGDTLLRRALALPQSSQSAQTARVTAMDVSVQDGTPQIDVWVSGNTGYQWHRLRDKRWYVDIAPAQLAAPIADQTASDPVQSVRVHQNDAQTVRVALTLSDDDAVDATPSAHGLHLAVRNEVVDANAPRSGSGTIGSAAGIAQTSAQPSPSASAPASHYTAANPRLIVIDPGHGGSDPGTIANGLQEKTVTLDIAKRLRDVLVARGWKVILTREDDRDVDAAAAPPRAELQARVDAANNNGARMFISIHGNGFPNAGPHGTTTYYSKPVDVPLARDIERRMAAMLGTTDDGIVKSRLYVTLHAAMPAVLIETAFLTNPFDAQKLSDAAWRQRAAQAIALGIADYAGSQDASVSNGGLPR